MSDKTLVVMPTYNERDNLPQILAALHRELPEADVLVIDDGSPDGTGQLADELATRDRRIKVLHRAGKLGLGTAYIAGFKRALADGYDYVFEMDADFSHDPRYLPVMLARAREGVDLVIGSRYVKGGGTENWGLGRRLISKGGGFYARTVLGVKVRDLTAGFKCFRRRVLEKIELDAIHSEGYGFQIEMTYRTVRAGLRVEELPIVFPDRRVGQSKMSRRIMLEALVVVWRLRLGLMATRIYIGLHVPGTPPVGQIHDREHATVSVFDRGFLYGDGVFEAFRTQDGVPLFLDEHLYRLHESAAAVAMAAPPAREISAAVLGTIAAAEAADPAHGESYVRTMLSRGEGEIGLDPALAEDSGPRLVVIVMPVKLPSPDMYAHGGKLHIAGKRRSPRHAMDPKVKSSNYLNNVLALAEARKAGAYEAVMLDGEGRIAEGSTSNVFLVRGGTLITPALEVGILEGITRRHVLALARAAGLTVVESRPLPEDLESADEAFITSSIRGVVPMTRVGDHVLAGGQPGPLTRRLMGLYDELCVHEALKVRPPRGA